MTSKNLLRIALVSASFACANTAFAETPASAPAKGTGTHQRTITACIQTAPWI